MHALAPPRPDGASIFLAAVGSFWLFSGARFFAAIERGDTARVAALHQDLAPSASRAAWRYKNLALAAVGALWVCAAAARALRPGAPSSPPWLWASAAAVVAEQLSMPALTPRHAKSWAGVLVGVALALAVVGLDGVEVGAAPVARHRRELVLVATLGWWAFAGALGAVWACVVPTWRSLPPLEFRDRFLPFVRAGDRAMAPLGRAALVASLAAAAASVAAEGPSAAAAALALAPLCVWGISFAFNVPVNRRALAKGEGPAGPELDAMRARWARGHRARTLVALATALGLAAGALRGGA